MIQAFMELKALHRLLDSAGGKLEKAIGVPACIPNCGLCCMHNATMCTIIEGINAVSVMTGQGKLKQVADLAEGWLLEKHNQATIYEGMPLGLLKEKLQQEWLNISKVQCAFLTENKQCFIHDVRPLTCRAYGIYRDAYPLCPRPLGKGESQTRHAIIDSSLARPLVAEFGHRCKARKPEWMLRGFTPAMIMRAARPNKFHNYVENNQIASAKLVGVDFDIDLMWQPQLDMLRAGKKPIEVVAAQFYEESPDPRAVLAKA